MRLTALFLLLLPLMEIAGFVLVGQWLGVLPTLALVIGSSLLGLLVLRSQGISLAQRLRRPRSGDPERAAKGVLNGTAQMFGGLLLILPGFITDILGLLLLVPMVRSALWKIISPRLVFVRRGGRGPGWQQRPGGPSSSGPGPAKAEDIIDLDEKDYQRHNPNGSSPWTRLPGDEGKG
ncbi:FxsA family protein [Agrobacterium vitis]|uniref:FxsA family protein n=1 Tax=Allorhizobium ampelinum TaxID=3025782 RepID=UPI001F489F2B|nr:FxsA family protein [Allorhizobium ampelinum]MCF1474101.1 FxsA family protein [Allorhizobium ampelinum]